MSGNVPWKALERTVHVHRFRKIEDVVYELPDGRQEVFSLFGVGKVVCALALTGDGRVVLARQFRPGPGRVLDELPGGGAEGEETPEEAIRRELLEETGFEAGRLVSLGQMYECAYSTVERHAFLALDCRRVAEPEPDRDEFIEVVLKSVPDFIEQIKSGLCTDLEVAWAGLLRSDYIQVTRA